MKTQKELRAIYQKDLEKLSIGSDPKHVAWKMGKAKYIVELEDGGLYIIEKPSLKKDFCFGYHDHVVHDDGRTDYEAAGDSAHNATTNEDYLMHANLKPLLDMLAMVEDEDKDIYVGNIYKDDRLERHLFNWGRLKAEVNSLTKLGKTDRKNIADGYREVIDYMTKRVKSYLKRYGLKHVHSWTYWADA